MGCLPLLCLNVFSSITADFNISSAIRWAIQDQWSSGFVVIDDNDDDNDDAICCCYAPNFEEVDRAYWFRVVCASVCLCVRSSKIVHARVLKFHIWIPHGKIVDARFFFFFFFFFSCPSYLPFWSYAPLKKKKRMKSDACHILRTVHARVSKFHVWIPHGIIADPQLFFCPSYLPFWSYAPFKKSEWNLVSKISRKVF